MRCSINQNIACLAPREMQMAGYQYQAVDVMRYRYIGTILALAMLK
jgi:hypothetical protein